MDETFPRENAEEHLARLEQTVQLFGRQLQEAQEAGVPNALLLPRMVAALKSTFGDPPDGADLPALLSRSGGVVDWSGYSR